MTNLRLFANPPDIFSWNLVNWARKAGTAHNIVAPSLSMRTEHAGPLALKSWGAIMKEAPG